MGSFARETSSTLMEDACRSPNRRCRVSSRPGGALARRARGRPGRPGGVRACLGRTLEPDLPAHRRRRRQLRVAPPAHRGSAEHRARREPGMAVHLRAGTDRGPRPAAGGLLCRFHGRKHGVRAGRCRPGGLRLGSATTGDPMADLGWLASTWQDPGEQAPTTPGPSTVAASPPGRCLCGATPGCRAGTCRTCRTGWRFRGGGRRASAWRPAARYLAGTWPTTASPPGS